MSIPTSTPMSATRWLVKRNLAIGTRIPLVSLVFSLFICLAACTLASAQSLVSKDVKHDSPGREIRRGESVHVDVDLALINVTVTDPRNRPIIGLEPDNFRVFEDNVEQEVVNFSSEDVPVSIGVIFDVSGSMANKLGSAREAAVQFFNTINSQDEAFLIGLSAHAELLSPFTNNIAELQNRLLTVSARGSTALLDGIYMGMREMRRARNAKRAI